MKTLVIVESPTKAKTLGPMLGSSFIVRASMGHIRDLPERELGIDLEADFKPSYMNLRTQAKTIKGLREAVTNADRLFLATDPDREGEAIAWHLLQVLKPRNIQVQRITFHEITPSAIKQAFSTTGGSIDMHLVDAQQARRVLDRLVGYQVSPLLWKTKLGKSAGRVQSVALRLVVDREREIRAFNAREYWGMAADLSPLTSPSQSFLARLVQIGSFKVGLDQPIMLRTRAETDQLIAVLQGAEFVVKNLNKEKRLRKPWPPFTTSTLQQSASARLGMSPADTMKVAQELYEGLNLGDGKSVGLITYMRTDSTAVSAEAQKAVRGMVTQTLGTKYLPREAPAYTTKVKNAQEAHEAIRPTDMLRYPNTIKPHLTARQFQLYDLIWRRFVASQMTPAVYDVMTIDVHAVPMLAELPKALADMGMQKGLTPFLFRATGRELFFDGFLRVWQEPDATQEDTDTAQKLPSVSLREKLILNRLMTEQHFTQPPSRFTEAALIKALEDHGIGRPSTYASIMSTLKSRAVVAVEKRLLHPTLQGEAICDGLVAAFPVIMDIGFTAQVEDWLDDISTGAIEWVKVLRNFYIPFSQALGEAEAKMKLVPRSVPEHGSSTLEETVDPIERPARRTKRTRKASSTRSTSTNTTRKGRKAVNLTSDICPICGKAMVKRKGPHGEFLGCSAYPKCKGTRKVTISQSVPATDVS